MAASSRLPIPRKPRRVSFSDSVREHFPESFSPVNFTVPISRSYEPPPTPHLGTCPLPGTPELTLGYLEEENADDDDTAALHAPTHTPTPANSPATQPVPVATPMLSPASSLRSSHSSAPSASSSLPESDLSPCLARFPVEWNVRKLRSPAGQPQSGCLRAPAFRSGRTSCVVHFVPDPIAHRDDWYITIRGTRSLTVGDVASRIGEELYTLDTGTGIYEGHPREVDARRERLSRLMGEVDIVNDTLRAIDLYPEDWRYFVGLEELVPEDGDKEPVYVVHLARSV